GDGGRRLGVARPRGPYRGAGPNWEHPGMTDMVRAMTPTATLTTEDAALGAAKISAVGVVIGAVNSAVTGWYASTPEGTAAAGRMVESLTGQAPDAAQLAGQAQMGLYFTGALVLLQLGLAVVQWVKPNGVIPIVFLVLVVWALGSSALALAMPGLGGSQPMWLTLFTLVTMLFAATMHIAGIRGAGALRKFREAQAY
ncbi:MAG: hypothetical protein K0M78_01910, partial [Brevundimonas sp.]|nr:hypothetical protein [Brevundimonas sp.]